MTERTIFAVSKGSYSDYRVMCVCETKRQAKNVVARYNATENYVEAFVEEILIVDDEVAQVETLVLSTTLWDDGRETETRESRRIEWPFDALYGTPAVSWRWVRAPFHGGKGGRLDVHGTDHERVRRVYSEQRAALMTDDGYRARREMKRTLAHGPEQQNGSK